MSQQKGVHRSLRSVDTVILTALLCLASITAVGVAYATTPNPQVIVEHVTALGVFRGRQYVQVEGLMVGTFLRQDASTGMYRVPLILAFPARHLEEGNDGKAGKRIGLVDVPNSAPFEVSPQLPLTEADIYQFALLTTGDYLWRQGYTYLAVQWSKRVTDRLGADPPAGRSRRLGYGVIERETDSTQILQDASHLLRHPVALGALGTLEPVEHVLAFGFSQSARVVSTFIRAGVNHLADRLVYDGFAVSANIAPSSTPFPAGQGKIMALYTESDLAFFRAARDRVSTMLAEYRHYELAGVAHLPTPIFPLDALGATRQNPADFAPVQRAILANLVAWIRHGEVPPPSAFLEGTVLSNGLLVPARDADGNALGGLRLPHMPTIICDDERRDEHECRATGAPLGTYTGLEPNVPPSTNLFVHIGGTFTPFSPHQLTERYRHRGHYVQLVRRAAQQLRQQAYILPEDSRRYVREAVHQPLW